MGGTVIIKFFFVFIVCFSVVICSKDFYFNDYYRAHFYKYVSYSAFSSHAHVQNSYDLGIIYSKKWPRFGLSMGVGVMQAVFDQNKVGYMPRLSAFYDYPLWADLIFKNVLDVSVGAMYSQRLLPAIRFGYLNRFLNEYYIQYGVGFSLDEVFFSVSFRRILIPDFIRSSIYGMSEIFSDSLSDGGFQVQHSSSDAFSEIQSNSLDRSSNFELSLIQDLDAVTVYRFNSKSFKDIKDPLVRSDILLVSQTGVYDSFYKYFEPDYLMDRYALFEWSAYLNLYWKYFNSVYMDIAFKENDVSFSKKVDFSMWLTNSLDSSFKHSTFRSSDFRNRHFQVRWFYELAAIDEGVYLLNYRINDRDPVVVCTLEVDSKSISFRDLMKEKFDIRTEKDRLAYVYQFSSHFVSKDQLFFSQQATVKDLVVLLGQLMNSYAKTPLFIDLKNTLTADFEEQTYIAFFIKHTKASGLTPEFLGQPLTRAESAHLIALSMRWFDSYFSYKEYL